MNYRLPHLFLSFLALIFLNACQNVQLPTSNSQSNIKSIDGQVYYLERKLLPPGAVLEITLEDVSKMDVASTQIVSVIKAINSAPPYSFSLEYDANLIKPNMKYSLRAKIVLSNRLLMTSTEHINPFADNPDKINIKLSSVATRQTSHIKTTADNGLAVVSVNPLSSLSNTYWKLMTLNGKAVNMTHDQKREAFFQLNEAQGTVKGFGSCNQLQGSFKAKGNYLNFGPIASTRKACIKNMNVESKFLAVLDQTAYYSIHEHDLTLLDNTKKPIARFHAQYFN